MDSSNGATKSIGVNMKRLENAHLGRWNNSGFRKLCPTMLATLRPPNNHPGLFVRSWLPAGKT